MKKLFIIVLAFASCSATNKRPASEPPHFFACNTWTDRNNDGKYDSYEFENIKTTFTSSQKILFVGFFNYPVGSKLTFRLFAPDGSVFHELSQTQLFRGALLRSEYSVKDLISQKSTGVWTGVWDAEGDIAAETDVNLIY